MEDKQLHRLVKHCMVNEMLARVKEEDLGYQLKFVLRSFPQREGGMLSGPRARC